MERKNEIINDLLGYEGLKIIQRQDIFNFSLDSTILADFVSINQTDQEIVDLGCGNGYIPIFLTLRTKAHITGIEIQEEIADIAHRSVLLNNLESQITIKNIDMKDAKKELKDLKIDVITCNPPYFKYKDKNSLTNVSNYQTIARHEVKITLEEVLQVVNSLLKDGGTFAMVHRSERLLDVIESFRKNHIEPKRMRFVYPKTTSKMSLALLIEGKKRGNPGGLKVLPPLYVYDENNKYTEEILKIFNYQSRK